MKNLFLIPVTLFCLNVSAQSSLQIKNTNNSNAIVAANGTINATTAANANTKITLDVKNISGSTHTYNAKRYDVLLNSVASTSTAADAYFCFAGSCYGDMVTTSPSPLVLRPNQSASDTSAAFYMLAADLDEASSAGISIVKYTFINVNTPSDSVQVTIKYNGATVGINKISQNVTSFDIFPNPAADNAALRINSLKAFDSKLMIYNSLGAVVSEKQVAIAEGKNSIDLEVSDLPAGLYFVNIKNGEASVTKRLIVK